MPLVQAPLSLKLLRLLVSNVPNYLLNETGLIAGRGKQITLRPLNKKLAEQRPRWQLLNLGAL